VVRVPLRKSQGRVLAHPVLADLDLPPFKKSFVDGYAVRSQDAATAPVKLEVIGVVAAGQSKSAPGRGGPGGTDHDGSGSATRS